VNIGARLEGIAEPGGICISEDAFRQVRGKVEAEFTDIGEKRKSDAASVSIRNCRGDHSRLACAAWSSATLHGCYE
jgi:class 3 adenylate cyclase